MKRRLLASLMSLCLLLGMVPTALATEGEADGGTPPACTCEALCTEASVDVGCPVCGEDYTLCAYEAPADDHESIPCAKTEGCILEDGHEGECVLPDGPEMAPTNQSGDPDLLGGGLSAVSSAMSGTCGATDNESSVTWKIEGTTLTISGSGAIKDYAHHSDTNHQVTEGTCDTPDCDYNRPWASQIESITSIVIEDGVTGIGNCAFRSMSAVTSLSIGNSVTVIGENAFKDCEALTSIAIPDSVTELKGYCFYSCGSLNTIEIGTGLTTLDQHKTCFGGTPSLKSFEVAAGNDSYSSHNGVLLNKAQTEIVKVPSAISGAYDIPEGVTYVTGFTDCTKLAEITIPSTAIAISESCFKGCTALAKVNFTPTTALKYIGNKVDGSTAQGGSAFSGCTSLTEIVIPDSVEKLYLNTFANCTSLKTATLGTGINELRNNIFIGCSALETIYYNATSATDSGNNVNKGFTGSSSTSQATNKVKLIVGPNVTSIPAMLYSNQQDTATLINEIDISAATQLSNFVLNNRTRTTGGSNRNGDVALICGPSFENGTITIPTGYTYTPGEDGILSKVETSDSSTTVGSGVGVAVLNRDDWARIVVIKNGSVSMQVGGEATANASGGGAATISNWSADDGTVTVDNSGKITAQKVGTTSVTADVAVGDDIHSTLTINVKVNPRVLSFSYKGEPGTSSITYNYSGAAPALDDHMSFAWNDEPKTSVSLTEGVQVNYTYTLDEHSGGTGKPETYDRLPAAAGQYEVTLNLIDPNYTFHLTGDDSGTGNQLSITVNVEPEGETRAYLAGVTPKAEVFTYTGNGLMPMEGVLQAYAENNTAAAPVEIGQFTISIRGVNDTEFETTSTTADAGTDVSALTGLTLPVEPGQYEITVSAQSKEHYLYKSLVFAIDKATVTIKPNDKSAYVGDTLPTLGAEDYTVTGLVGSDALKTAPTLSYEGTPNMSAAGSYVIKASGAEVPNTDHYHEAIVYQNGALTVSNRSSGGSGSGGSASSTGVTGSGDDVTIDISGSTVSSAQMDKAVDRADKGETITIDAGRSASVSLPADGMKSAARNDNSLTVELRHGEVTLSPEALASVADQAGRNATITVDTVNTRELNSRQQAAVGNAPVFDLTIKSGSKTITDFGGGLITVSLPYELPKGQDPAGVVVWFLDDNGNITPCETMYDVRTETVIFTTRHFSLYVIGYVQPQPFTDVDENAYYADAVAWAVANNVTAGTSATTFSPDASCTRAQMVTFLWRAAGEPKVNGTNPFTDVQPGSYYYDAVLWAVANGITSGTSATTFSPDATVTRGQTVTFLYRAAGAPAVAGANTFTDVPADAFYASAVQWAVNEGVTGGTSATTFSPDSPCTRAQIVTFLYRGSLISY